MEISKQQLSKDIVKYNFLSDGRKISFKEWIQAIKESDSFRELFISELQSSSFEAYFWEVKPVTQSSINDEFEFVLVRSSSLLSIVSDQHTFKEHFNTENEVVSFSNLGGDAMLIVPRPVSEPKHYSHLANFMRNAPKKQINSFWIKAATEYEKRIGDEPTWLSTAGLGVSWLHLRIDSRPKYYRFTEYKTYKTIL